MYALTSASRLYTVDVNAATVTAVGTAPFTPALDGRSVGFDFNPTVDRIRVVTDARQNLRLNPNDGTALLDGRPAYAAGDAGAATAPIVIGAAYTNSVAGATTTQLFDVEVARDSLVLQSPPNPGTLTTVGALGVNATSPVGFDITTANGNAYATFRERCTRGTGLYQVDLTTGRATLLGKFRGAAIRAMAVRGTLP